MAWPEKAVERLREYQALGLSRSIMADRLNAEFGSTGFRTTRSAVCAKCSRNRIMAGDKVVRRNYKRRPSHQQPRVPSTGFQPSNERKQAIPPEAWTQTVPDLVVPVAERKQLLDESFTDKNCHWPIGEVGKDGFGYCARTDLVPGACYCEFHYRRMYQPPKVRARQQAVATRSVLSPVPNRILEDA